MYKMFVISLFLFSCDQTTITTQDKIIDDEVVLQDADGDGYFEDEDCDDQNALVNSGSSEVCDGIDNNCDGFIDEGVLNTYFEDADGDGFGGTTTGEFCSAPDGYVPSSNDCDDNNAMIFIGNNEECDGLDNNCNGEVDEGVGETYFRDSDGDGYGDPELEETLCAQAFGYVVNDSDCDDGDANIYPNAPELCDGLDNNCDLISDEGVLDIVYLDADLDGYGTDDTFIETCSPIEGYVTQPGDCDDINPLVFPGATEVCDGEDNDCDGDADSTAIDRQTWYVDSDLDGAGDPNQPLVECVQPSGSSSNDLDCDDSNNQMFPGNNEICDGIDNDCDGAIDDADSNVQNQSTWFLDADNDGYGNDFVSSIACTAPIQFIAQDGDCNDLDPTVSPVGVEVCDLVDNNCDGYVDEGVLLTFYYDGDGDTYGNVALSQQSCTAPGGYTDNPDDCNDGIPEAYTGAPEVCDNIDNDCNGQTDEGVLLTWYLDLDGDGFGDPNILIEACTIPATGYTLDGGDCNESDTSDFPGAVELCDDVDHNCDGIVDFDSDGDGYSDYVCGGSDCDDSDAGIFPNTLGQCPLGTDCLDIFQQGYTASQEYTIDPDGHNTGVDAEVVWCEQSAYGGGWTRIATNDPSESLWNGTNIRDVNGFGLLNSGGDYKSGLGFSSLFFFDVMFTDNSQYAVYEGIGDGTETYYDFSASIPVYNCAPQSGYEWSMTQGDFGGGRLCSTSLYLHAIDRDGYSNCNPNAQWAGNSLGPTWSVYNNGSCPLDDPSGSAYISGTPNSVLPWSDSNPLYMYVR